MIRTFSWLFALTLICGCTPLTNQMRQVEVQQIPQHPVPAGTTYAVVAPPSSVGAAQLMDGIRIPGLTKITNAESADITIEANVGRATVTNLTVVSNQVERLVSSNGGPSEYTAYGYTGTISVPNTLHIRSKKYGETEAFDRPDTSELNFSKDPQTNQRFTDTMTLEASFVQQQRALLQTAELAAVRRLQNLANRLGTDQFTVHQDVVYVTLATAHKQDPRFAQAISLFDQAVAGSSGDATGRATRMKPAIDLWQQIAASPVGGDDQERTESKAAALYGQAVGQFLIGQLDEAERAAIAAKGFGVAQRDAESLIYQIKEKRSRLVAQEPKP